jgi:hypothetical protein
MILITGLLLSAGCASIDWHPAINNNNQQYDPTGSMYDELGGESVDPTYPQ